MTEIIRLPKPARRSPKLPSRIKNDRSRKGKKTSKRRRSRLSMRRECDKSFAVAIKERDDWQCKACRESLSGVQCAHIVSRRYHATRWLMGNAVALCAHCHLKFTHDPLAWDAWVEERIGLVAYNELKRIARQGVAHIDYEAILASLPEVPK